MTQSGNAQQQMLVTGGGGFLGLYIVEELLRRGHRVRVFCRGEYRALSVLGVEIVQGDLRDPAAVSNAVRGCSAVFHVAAIPGVWGPWTRYFETNTNGTKNILAACQQHSVERFIYTSSPSVVFDGAEHVNGDESLPYPKQWMCHYPHSKALAEQAVLSANRVAEFRTVSLRPHLIWGPRDNHLIPRLIERAASGRLRRVGDGTNMVSISYVENAAMAHVQVEERLRTSAVPAGKAYFINEPEAVNLWEWVDQLLQRAGLPPVQRAISFPSAARIGRVLEFLYHTLRLPGEPPMTRFVAAQLSQSHCYSIESATRDFGYDPQISIAEGMDRMQGDLARLSQEFRSGPKT